MRGTKRRGRRAPTGAGRMCLSQWQGSLSLTIHLMLVVWDSRFFDWLLHKSNRPRHPLDLRSLSQTCQTLDFAPYPCGDRNIFWVARSSSTSTTRTAGCTKVSRFRNRCRARSRHLTRPLVRRWVKHAHHRGRHLTCPAATDSFNARPVSR
jgi:hypothetical protein